MMNIQFVKNSNKQDVEQLLQPYKAFCHGFCRTTMQKPRQSLAVARARL